MIVGEKMAALRFFSPEKLGMVKVMVKEVESLKATSVSVSGTLEVLAFGIVD